VSVAAGAKRPRPGRDRHSERARLLRGRGVRQQAVARVKQPRRRTTSNPREWCPSWSRRARPMVWRMCPGAMTSSWRMSCSLDAPAVRRCPRVVLALRSGPGRANERRAVASNSTAGCGRAGMINRKNLEVAATFHVESSNRHGLSVSRVTTPLCFTTHQPF
jgi:hypothetical protein